MAKKKNKKSARILICEEDKRYNYVSSMSNKKNNEKITVMKYHPFLMKHMKFSG